MLHCPRAHGTVSPNGPLPHAPMGASQTDRQVERPEPDTLPTRISMPPHKSWTASYRHLPKFPRVSPPETRQAPIGTQPTSTSSSFCVLVPQQPITRPDPSDENHTQAIGREHRGRHDSRPKLSSTRHVAHKDEMARRTPAPPACVSCPNPPEGIPAPNRPRLFLRIADPWITPHPRIEMPSPIPDQAVFTSVQPSILIHSEIIALSPTRYACLPAWPLVCHDQPPLHQPRTMGQAIGRYHDLAFVIS